MQKDILENMIGRRLSVRSMAKECNCSYGKIRHWLKKYELKTMLNVGSRYGKWGDDRYICKFCGETDSKKFMLMANNKKSHTRCKNCHNKLTIDRGRKNKGLYIEYKGGHCERCGYDKCYSALDFHHLDSSKKDLNFTSMRYWDMVRAKKELDKCLLLCSNCHREKHEGLW